MKYLTLVLLASVLLSSSCKKDDKKEIAEKDYLIFGHFYGECMGEECIEIFHLTDEQLSEDQKDLYPDQTSFYNGDFTALSSEKFDLVKDLIDLFPEKLLLETDKVLGHPDAGDWGGLYIEYNFDGKQQFWLLDQKKSNIDEYLWDFVDAVNEKIFLINSEIKTSKAKILGKDVAACACCGDWIIDVDGEAKVFQFGELPSNTTVSLSGASFPLDVNISWVKDTRACTNRIILTKVDEL